MGKQDLNPIPDVALDDRRVLPVVDLILVTKPPDIDGVRQDVVDVASADQPSPCRPPRPDRSNGQADILGIEDALEPHDAADFQIASKEIADEVGLLLHDV